jgi:hypothetical protein
MLARLLGFEAFEVLSVEVLSVEVLSVEVFEAVEVLCVEVLWRLRKRSPYSSY